jgi:2-polyprenyl-3-methyl-5-hydroxy-6-metoxy-1,4-benzoquinol methylase
MNQTKTKRMPTTLQDTQPEWPASELEPVNACPVCGSEKRELLHTGLTDRVFFCAPGEWAMYRCSVCESGYLDPRPTGNSIGLAYQRYFTHDEIVDFRSLSFSRKVRRTLANGYRNWRYGTKCRPATVLGVVALAPLPAARAIIDAGMRRLQKAEAGKRLLDVGCGNGSFLLLARSAGWDVFGVDFDARAVEAANRQGLNVRLGGMEELDPALDQFDVITLSHVIEHVPQPVMMLQRCYELLRPGGGVWIETPNISSQGHRLFGKNWRGLEPPRHLVLFTLESMKGALKTAGFSGIEPQPYRPLCRSLFAASKAIAGGVDPYSGQAEAMVDPRAIREAEWLAKRDPSSREFLTVKAWKNSGNCG